MTYSFLITGIFINEIIGLHRRKKCNKGKGMSKMLLQKVILLYIGHSEKLRRILLF